jgi:NADH-quinone oxidoreductase subunit C
MSDQILPKSLSGDVPPMQTVPPESDHPALARLRERFPDAVTATHAFRGEPTAVIRKDALLDVVAWLRDDRLGFPWLEDLTAVDWPDRVPRFEVVYQLFSMERKEGLRLKVGVPESTPEVPSLTGLWPGADWFEREVYDLFGIRFSGHPNLARIMMPEGWQGNPLRKDYPLPGLERGTGAGVAPPIDHRYGVRPDLGPGAGGGAGQAPLTRGPVGGTRPRDVEKGPLT